MGGVLEALGADTPKQSVSVLGPTTGIYTPKTAWADTLFLGVSAPGLKTAKKRTGRIHFFWVYPPRARGGYIHKKCIRPVVGLGTPMLEVRSRLGVRIEAFMFYIRSGPIVTVPCLNQCPGRLVIRHTPPTVQNNTVTPFTKHADTPG